MAANNLFQFRRWSVALLTVPGTVGPTPPDGRAEDLAGKHDVRSTSRLVLLEVQLLAGEVAAEVALGDAGGSAHTFEIQRAALRARHRLFRRHVDSHAEVQRRCARRGEQEAALHDDRAARREPESPRLPTVALPVRDARR